MDDIEKSDWERDSLTDWPTISRIASSTEIINSKMYWNIFGLKYFWSDLGYPQPSLGQKYSIEVAKGLGSSPSTPVQLYIPMSLLRTWKGGSVQFMAGWKILKRENNLFVSTHEYSEAWQSHHVGAWESTQRRTHTPPVMYTMYTLYTL